MESGSEERPDEESGSDPISITTDNYGKEIYCTD